MRSCNKHNEVKVKWYNDSLSCPLCTAIDEARVDYGKIKGLEMKKCLAFNEDKFIQKCTYEEGFMSLMSKFNIGVDYAIKLMSSITEQINPKELQNRPEDQKEIHDKAIMGSAKNLCANCGTPQAYSGLLNIYPTTMSICRNCRTKFINIPKIASIEKELDYIRQREAELHSMIGAQILWFLKEDMR